MRRLLKIVLVTLLLIYAVACAGVYAYQAKLIFTPGKRFASNTPRTYGAQFQDFSIPGKNGTIHAWYVPSSSPTNKLLIYFHGNSHKGSAALSDNAEHAVRLSNLGASVLLFDYRGFGASSPTYISQKSIFEDVDSVVRYATDNMGVPIQQIVFYGHSLGGAAATEAAVRNPKAAGLILESTFTSIYAMSRGEWEYRILPLKWILNDHFDNLDKISGIHLPKLFIYGTADSAVPPAMMQQLYESAPEPKQLLVIEGGGHDSDARVGGTRYTSPVREFIQSI